MTGQMTGFCTVWQRFIPPDDLGLDKAAPLPVGHHYPQPSTDRPHGRARVGWFAILGAQIILVPWIQSTEQVLLYWDGIKRDWADIDLVDNDPLFKRTVEAYVRWQHEEKYGHDQQIILNASQSYAEGIRQLMYLCRQENEIVDQRAMGFDDARGSSQVVKTYANEAQSATVHCQSPQTGAPVTVLVPAGTVTSLISVADANSKAASQALQQAGAQLDCITPPVVYENTDQHYTADCGAAQGNPVSVTITAGTFTSEVSQKDADDQAYAKAISDATKALECTYLNTVQTWTDACHDTSHSTTVTVPAGAVISHLSQSDADELAMASAKKQVNDALALVCPAGVVYHNAARSITVGRYCWRTHSTQTTVVSVAANVFSSHESQLDANNQADTYANHFGQNTLALQCPGSPPAQPPIHIGVA